MGATPQERFDAWIKTYDQKVEFVAYPKYWKQISHQDPTKEDDPASPQAARTAGGRLKTGAVGLRETAAGCRLVEMDMAGGWEGPAAPVYTKTVDAFRDYMGELSVTVMRYS